MLKKHSRVALILFSILMPNWLAAFPEMIRHGYPNCNTCHVSPAGGGVLTEYGREMTSSILSTWGKEGEGKLLWAAPNVEWLKVGGDVRGLYMGQKIKDNTKNRMFLMQAEGEAAVNVNRVTVAGTIGYYGESEHADTGASHAHSDTPVQSRRHYLKVDINDEVYIRGGRFLRPFGIRVADHVIATKKGLNWDQDSETYNVEFGWVGEKVNFFVASVLGRPGSTSLSNERGLSMKGSYTFAKTYKIGASYFFGESESNSRYVFGPTFVLGFTDYLFFLGEYDFVNDTATDVWQFAQYNRLDYEPYQGIHIFLTYDSIQRDISSRKTASGNLGGGIQFFPRPHFEILGSIQWMSATGYQIEADLFTGLVMLHYYL